MARGQTAEVYRVEGHGRDGCADLYIRLAGYILGKYRDWDDLGVLSQHPFGRSTSRRIMTFRDHAARRCQARLLSRWTSGFMRANVDRGGVRGRAADTGALAIGGDATTHAGLIYLLQRRDN